MIQVIIEYNNKEFLDIVSSNYTYNPVLIGAMLPNTYLILTDEDSVDYLESLVLAQGELKYIGCWNNDGSIFNWEAETHRNYSLEKYHNQLSDIVEYNENGEEISRRRPTETEALNTQVSKISGCANRVL